jgi:hypothetical protein
MSFLNRGNRGTLGLTALATLLGLAGTSIPLRGNPVVGEPRTPSLAYINKYRPHQGKRECARRRGGEDWMRQRNEERVRRGLPVRVGFFDAGFRDTTNDGGSVQ